MELNNKKIINAWCYFDWANSAYSLVITSTIFPVYYNQVTRNFFQGDTVKFFGFDITNSVLYSYSLSFSFLLIACISPFLSSISDYGGKKKPFMRFFTTLGALACIAMFFFTGENVELAIICSILASVGYAGGLVFYNAFLPEIVSPDRYDSVSARGFSMGYFGSVLLLIFNLAMVMSPQTFGLENGGLASRISFVMVGLWWFGFSQITFYHLKDRSKSDLPMANLLSKGLKELKKVFQAVQTQRQVKYFLISYFFSNAGVQTVMYLAATFGEKELHLPSGKLIATVLIIQIVAILGAYLSAKLSEKKGNKFAVMVLMLIWIANCLASYFVQTDIHFYFLATAVGLVMGGIQSLSRATYSKLLPENTKDTTSYFSFYDVVDKFAVVIGTASYGLIEQITGDMRLSSVSLALYFVMSLFFFSQIKVEPAK